ncbi:hypothetical protein [Streptomyces prasinopilosus]|uniref:hypothetical protein n=1 Tax=Streptomyces prasinopilosus TaxID=67344 RepID=UPI0006EBDFCD|nr:hypothetical protein [Streptomyces prasinopilosus]
MAITDAQSSGGFLSNNALALYAACARRDIHTITDLIAHHPDAETELLTWGLISGPHTPGGPPPAVRDPKGALQHRTDQVLAEAERHVAMLQAIPDLSAQLTHAYQAVQIRSGGSSVYLDDPDTVNSRLQDVVGSARREILAAQPGGPRSPDLLELAVSRDGAALDRGVELRTIYRDTVRDHPVTARYARTMSTRATGRPAQYRTLESAFERMIVVDREQAFLSDHITPGGPAHAAWLVTDPAVVAVLARVFEATWMRARPWAGQLRARRGDVRDTLGARGGAGVEGVRTSRSQREIMRHLCSGFSQPTIARRFGVSERKLEKEIAVLKGLWGVSTMNELIYHWAQSVDCRVDDSAPAGEPAGEAAA